MPKKIKVSAKSKASKAVQKARMKEAESADLLQETRSWMADVAGDIAASPLADGYKAMFLYSIAQGTYDEVMHQRFLDLLAEYRRGLLEEAKRLEAEIAQLKSEQKTVNQELAVAAVGASQELEAAAEHLVQSAYKGVEKAKSTHEASEIEQIRKKLKKS